MKLTVVQSKLSKALNTVSRTISTKSTLPILSHLLLQTDKGRLKISSTNLEIGVNFYIGGKIDQPGAIAIPARIFSEFISSINDEKISIDTDKQILKVKSDKVDSSFHGSDAKEFPLIPDIKDKKSITLNGKELKEAITLVSFAAAQDETRPILSGILLKSTDDKMILAATDSYRLAEKIIDLPKKSSAIEVIIPAKTLIELSRILSDFEDDVDIYVGDSQISFVVGDIELVSRLIEGQFPNYLQIIPEETQTKTEVQSSEFIQGLKVAYLFAKESANSVKISFDPKGEIVFRSTAGGVGDNVTKTPAKIEGDFGEITFNARFLLDVFSVLKDEKVKIEISGKLNPGIIKPLTTKNYLYILMPLKS